MAMALKADVTAACRAAGMMKPVDLVHLSSITMGDRDLEHDVLGIFLNQSEIYLAAYRSARGQEARHRAAHSLKGAARGIGAWQLGEIAEAAGQPGFADFDALADEVARVRAYIEALGPGNG